MNLDDQLSLSFYREVAEVDKKHGVILVQHVDTGKVFVRKDLSHYDKSIFEFIKEGRFSGVPVIHDLIETQGKLIVIEDYISGHSVAEILESELFDTQTAGQIIKSLCEILKPFHKQNPPIIHRDIKDSNVIIDNEGNVYLIDFDASKRVIHGKNRDTELIGTEEYAAPEQYGFGQSDQRTDIYALGVLLNKMLTGKFVSEERRGGVFGEIIDRASEIDPDNRYQNVDELVSALNAAAEAVAKIDVEIETSVESEPVYEESFLERVLKRLPYHVRELPGFRAAKPLRVISAIIWYAFLIFFGFFGVSENPDYTAIQNRYYDVATFCSLMAPTLYLGNYLGVRDRMPWRKVQARGAEALRIAIGAALSIALVVFTAAAFAVVLGF